MISFACPHCGMKFQVKGEFAGRVSKCRTCRQPITVPDFPRTQSFLVPTKIEGIPSALTRAGVAADIPVTLEHPPAAGLPGPRSLKQAFSGGQSAERYLLEGEIARGGMGAVIRGVDCDIRREVAVKYLLDSDDPQRKARFIEEAQITGQLEHPNIVPIHELGLDKQGRFFISMKLVQGKSLAQIFEGLVARNVEIEKAWPLGRLLTALVSVCNALAYAHSRGVIHRDLKPANIMVGDFGEVYVMDWGLARVMGRVVVAPTAEIVLGPDPAAPVAVPVNVTGSGSGRSSSQVVTSRDSEADLTREGTVMGTPLYMPPEQACGQIAAIDQRSDVYSLGAILYELLTLHAPVEKTGGSTAILERVLKGEISPPETRDLARHVPRELSAIAMKALAKEPAQRYPTVDAMKRDIELFQEGRSVSAKQDTFREAAWKLVKRNKQASVATALSLVVLAVVVFFGYHANSRARIEAEDNYAANQKAQEEKRELGRKAVPGFMRIARESAQGGKLEDAMIQVEGVMGFDDQFADAHLLRGQLLIGAGKREEAARALEACLKLDPKEAKAKRLLDMCRAAGDDEFKRLLPLAEELRSQEFSRLASLVEKQAEKLEGSRKALLDQYRNQIEKAWKGSAESLTSNGEKYHLILHGRPDITDLKPVQGLPLASLDLTGSKQIEDLTPLKDMPLTFLSLKGCPGVGNLTPLKGMQLRTLSLNSCSKVVDLSPLKGMPLESLELTYCQMQDLTPLKGMPLKELELKHCRKVESLAGLEGMKTLRTLDLSQGPQVRDLTPLKDIPLSVLDLTTCHGISDLTPLKGMPLKRLHIANCNVKDLSPLENMPLERLYFTPKNIDDKSLKMLRGMQNLEFGVSDGGPTMSKKEFWERFDKGEFK